MIIGHYLRLCTILHGYCQHMSITFLLATSTTTLAYGILQAITIQVYSPFHMITHGTSSLTLLWAITIIPTPSHHGGYPLTYHDRHCKPQRPMAIVLLYSVRSFCPVTYGTTLPTYFYAYLILTKGLTICITYTQAGYPLTSTHTTTLL